MRESTMWRLQFYMIVSAGFILVGFGFAAFAQATDEDRRLGDRLEAIKEKQTELRIQFEGRLSRLEENQISFREALGKIEKLLVGAIGALLLLVIEAAVKMLFMRKLREQIEDRVHLRE